MSHILAAKEILSFQTELLSFYQKEGRSFLWRNTQNPYHILVSEIMLQQTQTDRVVPKYEAFLLNFPTLQSLADAPLREVLTLWQGLGYNRRAMGLHKAAQIVAYEYQGMVPDCQEKLMQLPSIGPYTAGAVCAFAFNQPTVFIETNIRSVFIHFFFQGLTKIPDRDIMPLIKETLHEKDPRSWYYALMDYGVMLKKKAKNPSKKSAHYTIQSKFEGSDRQIRGAIIRLLTQHPAVAHDMIIMHINKEPDRINNILNNLCSEGLIQEKKNMFFIPNVK